MIDQLVKKMLRTSLSKEIEPLIHQVVASSTESICQRVANRMDGMSLSEARGYIRARSATIIRRETRLSVSRLAHAELAWAPSIVRAATERIVPLVLRQAGVGVPCMATVRQAA